MKVLIIGADRIDTISSTLKAAGVEQIVHWNGRKQNRVSKKSIPKGTDIVILLTDFLKHNTMKIFKKEAKRFNIPFICTRRCESDILCKLCQITCMQRDDCPFNKEMKG